MNNENEVRNFYEEEKKYEESIIETKRIIEKIINTDFEILKKKISNVDADNQYEDYISLLSAVIGRATSKYYYCKKEEDVKYYGLELGRVYELENLNKELQVNNSKEQVLDLEARAILSQKLLFLTNSLKEIFNQNLLKSDNSFVTLNSEIITETDLDYLDNLMEYLKLMLDKSGRLKILVAERDVYALEKAKKDYSKKTSVEKIFHKILKTEQSVINSMANKNKN